MAVHAVFVGASKHRDERVHELSGAAKDARAFRALLKDSLVGIQDRLILDERASAKAIREAFRWALGTAKRYDSVVAYFAGHGTPGHFILPFDADLSALDQTAIPLQEIADLLRTTAAGRTIVVFDCCFSGGAPARAVEIPRYTRQASHRVTDLGGSGHVVLAAAGDDQPAIELGGRGLFTSELIRALRAGFSLGHTDILMGEVARRVCKKAEQAGHKQTPVWAGRIMEWFGLPRFRGGPNLAAELPDTSRIRIGPDIRNLSRFKVPRPVLDAWAARFSRLNDLQLSAVNEYRVLDGQHLLVTAPTASGKTFIGELAAARAMADGRKAVFLLPYRALTNEKHEEFKELYGRRLGLRVLILTGEHSDRSHPFVSGRYDIALLTYEMFLGLSTARPELLPKIGLVVLDEAQFIADSHRGIVVELLLTRLRSGRNEGIEPQLVALSAVLGELNRFDEWLACRTLSATARPVPLVEGVIDRDGIYQYVAEDGQSRIESVLDRSSMRKNLGAGKFAKVIYPLVRKLVGQGEKVLIFRNTKRAASSTALGLSEVLRLPPATSVLKSLPTLDLSAASHLLKAALEGGTAFHTSDLSKEERVAVEQAFRDPEGPIRALAATSTVAAGVNTPAETVIVVETRIAGPEGEPYSVATYKNMVGRAGRPGFATKGRSVLVAADARVRADLFRRFVRGVPEAVRSSFDKHDLGTWLLRLLCQVGEVRPDEAVELVLNTYGGYIRAASRPSWGHDIHSRAESAFLQMRKHQLLEGTTHLRLTPLGRVCGRAHFSLASALTLIRLIRSLHESERTAHKLLGLIHAVPEIDKAYTPFARYSGREPDWGHAVAIKFGVAIKEILRCVRTDRRSFQKRCKRLAVIQAWIEGVPMAKIERGEHPARKHSAFPVPAGNVRGMVDLARHHLTGACEIARTLTDGNAPTKQDVRTLLACLESGPPSQALSLLGLPCRLDRGAHLALWREGLLRPRDVVETEPVRLREIVGSRAQRMLLA